MGNFQQTFLNPKGKFWFWGIGVAIILGVALMVVPGLFLGNESAVPVPISIENKMSKEEMTITEQEKIIAADLSSILKQVAGAGEVSVIVTLESGLERNYARNITDDETTIEEKDSNGGSRVTTENNYKAEFVFAQGQDKPLLIKENGMQIKGVLVVAEGAKDADTRAELSRAVQTMLNLSAHRVMVLPKESR